MGIKSLFKLALTILIFLNFFVSFVFAAPKRKDRSEFWELKVELLEAEYKKNATEDLKQKLFEAKKQFLLSACFSGKPLEFYVFNPDNSKCVKAIDGFKKFFPSYPLIKCAESSFNSSICREAFLSQISVSQKELAIALRNARQKDNLLARPTYKGNLNLLRGVRFPSSLLSAEKKFQSAFSKESYKELTKEYRAVLSRFCTKTKEERLPKEYFITSVKYGKSAKIDELKKLADSLVGVNKKEKSLKGTKKKKEEKKSKEYLNVRVLSNLCMGYIQRYLQIHPFSSDAICWRDGFYTPYCLDARRNEREWYKKKFKGVKEQGFIATF